ncbi:hypothetical protein LR48_Vigan11g069700 [Vigna angularis]|uniref:Uncharacterized protein n=1 Tax=Phaseolus angularis TaxID=3914 RepID=A0A0L9VSC5_PHAAN|nr:hypothetical protein LR48_Vigan11g069700 [Vigna angularis]
MEKPQLPLSGSLPLSGTQKLTGGPLRGKMATEGKNRAHALTAERLEDGDSSPLLFLGFFYLFHSSIIVHLATLPLCSSTQKSLRLVCFCSAWKLVSVELVKYCYGDRGNSRFILGVSEEVFGRGSSSFVKYSEEVFILCDDSKEV